jgi:peptide/nickel transport system substrate-binding protein
MLFTLVPSKSLSIGLVDNPKSFLPMEVSSESEILVSNLIFRKLFKYQDGELIYDLVDKYSTSEDMKEHYIKLKNDIFWQDGIPITSNDVIYTLTKNEGIRDQVDIEKLSDKEVKITLTYSSSILPSLLTFGVEPEHLKGQSKIKPIGSTSYRIARIIQERDKVEGVILQSLKKNKQYPRIRVMFYKDENDLKTAYDLGEIKVFLSNTRYETANADEYSLPYLGRYFSLIFNTQNEKLSDPLVRDKLWKSLDIQALKQNNYYNNALVAEGPISFTKYTKPAFRISGYNPETILTPTEKDIINDLSVLLPNNQDGRQIELFLKQYWGKALGVDVRFEYEDINNLMKRGRGGEFEVIFIGHEVKPDPDRYAFWHSTQSKGGLNFGRFEDLRADRALEEGRNSTDPLEREKHYNIFQDVVITKVPAVFLYHPGQYLYVNKGTPIPFPKEIYYPSDIISNL